MEGLLLKDEQERMYKLPAEDCWS